jgi:hypothetical protein
MKKHNLHRSRPVIASFLAALLLGLSSFTMGNDPIVKTASVKHIGDYENNMVLQVMLDNETGERFSVTIKDAEGSVLFTDSYSDKKFDKRFLFNKGEGLTKLNVIVRSLKDKQAQTFVINTSTRIVENYDVTVTKL